MRLRTICILSLSVLLPLPAVAADMIQNYEPQRKREYVRYERPVRATYVERRKALECGDLIVEYRYVPRTEIVTVCHPPVF
ncbi:hypothetical protein EYC79_06275 [Agrobacterium cavarae]|uniref:Uncharacterized protein n=1 Tax=Agrobacterium cavarae TaxID=2528239 RepID=A0ABY1YBJ5_9HYPH|nr:hypothetical protein EYC79_06275 [Agrobacterium cavarae]